MKTLENNKNYGIANRSDYVIRQSKNLLNEEEQKRSIHKFIGNVVIAAIGFC